MDEPSIISQNPDLLEQIELYPDRKEYTREIVLQLKAAIKAKGLTPQDVIEMCDGKPDMPSSSTIRRIFGNDGENKTYNYRLTLKPLVKLLLDITPESLTVPSTASEEQHEIAALKSVILAKEQICVAHEERIKFLISRIENRDNELKRQAELFTRRIEKLDAELDKANAEIEEYRAEKKDAEKAAKKDAKARKIWSRIAIIALIFIILYLLFIDVPNAEYGLFRFKAFLEETAAVFNGGKTSGVNQVTDFLRI